MRLRAFGAAIAGLSSPKGGVARRRTTAVASKGNLDGQAEGKTRYYSRVDGTCARETTNRPAGTGFCKSRDPTAQPVAQPPNGARRDHGMAAATHRTTLICGMRLPEAVRVFWVANGAKRPFASEPEAVALDCALEFESPPNGRPSMLLMSRLVFSSIAIVLSLLPVVAPAHNRPAPRWHGYGFLPGYHQPRITAFQLTPRKLRFRAWSVATGARGISIQSQVIT